MRRIRMNPIRATACGPYQAWISPNFDEPLLREPLQHLAGRLEGPEAVVLSGGRHRIVRLEWPSARGPLAVAVKAFGRQTLLKDGRARRRGTKAQRSFLAACRLRERGVGTPAPVACLERWQGGRLLESYYLSLYQPDLVSLRDELIRLYRHDPLCEKFMSLLQGVADAVRHLHAAGVRHNDLGNQNIFLRRRGDAAWDDVQFLDLNRARLKTALSTADRARDISRLTLPSDLRRVFMEMYFNARPSTCFQRWEKFYRGLFALHTLTRRYRHPFRERRPGMRGAAETYPPERDLWIWDERSAQAISALTRHDRHRYLPLSNSWQVARAVAADAWPVIKSYRALRAQSFAGPVSLAQRIGVALQPTPATADAELRLLADLGRIPVILRCYHHEPPAHQAFVAQLARRLHAAGHPVSIALVQDRRAVLEPARWRDFVVGALEPLADIVDWVEVGHAVNRVKWGLWRLEDYLQLLAPAIELQRRHLGLRLMGPAAIDFEYHYLMALLRLLPRGFRFQALSHHLYVDRRGAPENRQGPFAAGEKFALARAIAAWAPVCEPRLIVSEVNWPLLGTGVWSPVGSPYETPGPRRHDPSVTEQDYADYLLRYLLIALCSGLVERVYWWRLVARGFGLVDDTQPEPGAWRLRPAYHQLRFFLALLGDSTFERRLVNADGVQCYQFRAPDGARHALVYAHPAPARFTPPFAFQAACNARGKPLGSAQAPLDVGGSPLYLTGIS
ncbi:MAG: hypothetical protein NTV49_14735 [Kiritimatiellaeota bacterium]|nr:hypothetical protein [Kiritimatiellota bacterium]